MPDKKPSNFNFEYVNSSKEELFDKFKTSKNGLSHAEAQRRLDLYGRNEINRKKNNGLAMLLFRQITNPLVMLLIIIATFSWIFSDLLSAIIIYFMALMSSLASSIQEHRAEKAAEHLATLVKSLTSVIRDGQEKEIPFSEIVQGDIVTVSAGDVISADIRIIESNELLIDQSSLTGESFPVEKTGDSLQEEISDITTSRNMAFVGSHVASGSCIGIAINTGAETYFGKIYSQLSQTGKKTEFDKEIRGFTWLLVRIILIAGIGLFIINVFRGHAILGSLLFSLLTAITISPEILPMVIMFNLSRGALEMSKKKVVVKRLDAIQNFGAMDVLCCDKTGTLTRNTIILEKYLDLDGKDDEQILRYGYINCFFQTGLKKSLDQAILNHEQINIHGVEKIGEIPFDFERKIMSVVVSMNGKKVLISSGAPEEIIKRCSTHPILIDPNPKKPDLANRVPQICADLNADGFRVLAVATKEITEEENKYTPVDESDMKMIGYLSFLDPLKPLVKDSIKEIEEAGITLKVITGDGEIIAKKICGEVGLNVTNILTGSEIELMTDEELCIQVELVSVFARIVPLQKERVIKALQQNKHVVGYLGDGINDAPALKIADIGISVENAVNIAKESASIILLTKNLHVLLDGIFDGRRVFGNFIKYIRSSTSYYVGFIITSATMSFYLPFLPLLPLQILLNNYLYDIMQGSIPADNVDREYLQRPKTWNIKSITKYILILGPIYSIFDFIMIGILIKFFNGLGSPDILRTGWFLESFALQMLAFYVIRTKKIPFLQSNPSKFVMYILWILLAIPFIITFTYLASTFGFVVLPCSYYLILLAIVVLFLTSIHFTNNWFVKKFEDIQK